MPFLDFAGIVSEARFDQFFMSQDWIDWRYCYLGGTEFRREYLEPFSDRESDDEFRRRRKLTPIPTFAKRAVKKVENALAQRFRDIARPGGSDQYQEAMAGLGRGVDLRGTSMNTYLVKKVLPELLPMQRVGLLLDAPVVPEDASLEDLARIGFQPYLKRYPVEDFRAVPAKNGIESDWSSVTLRDSWEKVDPENGTSETVTKFTHYWLDDTRRDEDGRPMVSIQNVQESGKEDGPALLTRLTAIPFVVPDILASLIADACSYQITLLNMISADSNYAVDANYSFMVRQRSGVHTAHLEGDEASASTGTRKGLFYESDEAPPAFISPPTQPMKMSMELRREMKKEVEELVLGALQDIGDDGSPEAGLGFIGECLKHAEQRIADHWEQYEKANREDRKPAIVTYPESWSLKTDEERLERAEKFLGVSARLVGTKSKKAAIKASVEEMWRGKLDNDEVEGMLTEIDQAEYATSDPDIVLKAFSEGATDTIVTVEALGFAKAVAARAKKEKEEKAKVQMAAQVDAAFGAARGAPDLSVDKNSNQDAREAEVDAAQDEDRPGVRGEGRFNNDGE